MIHFRSWKSLCTDFEASTAVVCGWSIEERQEPHCRISDHCESQLVIRRSTQSRHEPRRRGPVHGGQPPMLPRRHRQRFYDTGKRYDKPPAARLTLPPMRDAVTRH
jgi:hypothetical protein